MSFCGKFYGVAAAILLLAALCAAGPVSNNQEIDVKAADVNIIIKISIEPQESAMDCNGTSSNAASRVLCTIFIRENSTQGTLRATVTDQLTTVAECAQLCAKSGCFSYQIKNVTGGGASNGTYLVVIGSGTDGSQTNATSATPASCNCPTVKPVYLCTSTTTATTTSTTTIPTTTTTEAPLPPNATQVALSATSSTGFTQVGSTISFPVIQSDFNNHSTANGQFNVASNGLYFVEACAGVGSGQTANIRVNGSAPLTIGLTWDSTFQNGVETQCRGSLASAKHGSDLSLTLDSGAAYSDSNNLLSFTVFSVSDSMTPGAISRLVYAVGPMTPPAVNQTLTPVPLVTVIAPANPSIFNPNTATYTCQSTGPHFVSVSAGVKAYEATELEITNDVISVGLTRTSIEYNGVTTLYRNTIVPCQQGATIQYNMVSGTVVNSDGVNQYNLTTLTVFPYEPRNVTIPVAWAVYKWYISFNNKPGGTSVLDPFILTNLTVNEGNAFSLDSYTLTAPVSGYYYTFVSCGAGVGVYGSSFTLQLVTGSTVLFGVEHGSSASKATDTFGRGGIVYLKKGDVVRLVGLSNSYFYSSLAAYEVSWIGMLLYETQSQ
jgi:hypothetical protein